jgi:hypothetical protein
MTNINISGQYKVNGVPLSLGSNPSVIALSATNGTVVTGTTSAAISRSLLVPANTFAGNGMLEILARCQKTGTVGGNSILIYTNTSSSLTGATLIATFSSNISATLVQGIRTFRINSNTLISFNASTGVQLDNGINTSFKTSSVFNTSVDNYILFCVQSGAVGDSNVVQMARVVKYA